MLPQVALPGGEETGQVCSQEAVYPKQELSTVADIPQQRISGKSFWIGHVSTDSLPNSPETPS
jgi:hypothetical protein